MVRVATLACARPTDLRCLRSAAFAAPRCVGTSRCLDICIDNSEPSAAFSEASAGARGRSVRALVRRGARPDCKCVSSAEALPGALGKCVCADVGHGAFSASTQAARPVGAINENVSALRAHATISVTADGTEKNLANST